MQIPGRSGKPDEYQNRIVAVVTIVWGRVTTWEDYEDTERVAAWDADRDGATSTANRAVHPG